MKLLSLERISVYLNIHGTINSTRNNLGHTTRQFSPFFNIYVLIMKELRLCLVDETLDHIPSGGGQMRGVAKYSWSYKFNQK